MLYNKSPLKTIEEILVYSGAVRGGHEREFLKNGHEIFIHPIAENVIITAPDGTERVIPWTHVGAIERAVGGI